MKLTIRPLVCDDIDLIVNCENTYFHNFTTRAKIEEDFENPLIQYYLLTGDEVLGYISLWIDEDKSQINSLVIFDQYRKKGYGFALLNFIFRKIQEQGVNEMTLEVRPSNLAALKLYEKAGFKQAAIRKAYYNNGEDAFLMYKRLGSD